MIGETLTGPPHPLVGQEVRESFSGWPLGRVKGLLVYQDGRQVVFLELAPALRPELVGFALALEETVRRHEPEKGSSWRELTVPQLVHLALKELDELVDATFHEGPDRVSAETLDVGALCLFLWARLQAGAPVRP